MESENIQYEHIFSVSYFLIPTVLALMGAFLDLPSWYYSLFKTVMVVDALMALCIFSICKSSNKYESVMILLGVTVVISFISLLGIVSQFFVSGGFPKVLWVILDFIYAMAKAIQYKISAKLLSSS